MSTRAHNPEAKLARQRAIIDAASRALHGRRFAEIKMADIAARSGVAKGTLYLYFEHKEDLFVIVLADQLCSWLAAMAAAFTDSDRRDAHRYADTVVATLAGRHPVLQLLPMQQQLLDGCTPEQADEFRSAVGRKCGRVASDLEDALCLPHGTGTALLTRTLALVVGMRGTLLGLPHEPDEGESAPGSLSDVDTQLREAIVALVVGIETDGRAASKPLLANDRMSPPAFVSP